MHATTPLRYYVITLYLPVFLINAISLVGLFTPSSNTLERLERCRYGNELDALAHCRCSMGGTAMLSVAVILLMLTDMMPKSAVQFPLIGCRFETRIACNDSCRKVCAGYDGPQYGRHVSRSRHHVPRRTFLSLFVCVITNIAKV